MKKYIILITLILSNLSNSQLHAQGAKHCDSVLEHGARNFISTMDFNSQKAYVYSKACNSQYYNSSGDTKLGIEAIIKKIPIGINLGKSDKNEQIQKWCKENKNLNNIITQYQYNENLVYGPAVDAWLNCKEAYASGLKVLTNIGSNNRSIAFHITNNTQNENVILRGIDISEPTISCTAFTDKDLLQQI
jgi:hypothetical protein